MNTTTTIIVVLAIYVVAMVAIGLYGRKYATTFTDTITAAKRSTLLMVLGSAMGAHIGSGFVVGSGEYGVYYGLSGAWYGLGCAISYIIAGVLFARFIYKHNYVSLSDYFLDRYGDRVTRLIYSISLPLSYVSGFASQILAGKALFVAFGIDGDVGLIIMTIVVLFYASLSGLWGAYMTSVIQVGVILVAMIVAFFHLLSNGAFALMSSALPAESFNLFACDPQVFILMVIPTLLSTPTDQTVFQRTASAKSEKAAVWGHIIGGLILIPVAFIPVLMGMYGSCVMPDAEPASVLVQVVLKEFSPILAAIFIAAVLCAIMSTCDGIFIGASTTVIHDIYRGMINPNASEEKCKRYSTILNVILAALGVMIALSFNSIIALLSMSYTILFSGCLVPFVGGLLWKKGNTTGALGSAVCGIGCSVLILAGIFNPPYSSIFPALPSLIGYIVFTLIGDRKNADK